MSNSKEVICEALRECMRKQPLASISIQGVCDKAGLSRKTFSRNFVHLQEVVAHQIFLDFSQPMCELNRIMGDYLVGNETIFSRNLHTLKQHQSYYEDVAATYGKSWLWEQFAHAALSVDFDPYDQHQLNATEHSFVEHFYAYAVASTYRWWMDEGMQTPVEDVARMIDRWLYARSNELNERGRS